MSKQTNEALFAPYEAKYKSVVMHETWGHLFPEQKQYKGTVRVAYSIYGDIVVLDENIEGIDSSPWWFDAVNSFAGKMSDDMDNGDAYEFQIIVDIVQHKEPDEYNDPEHPEDDLFDEFQTIEISLVNSTKLIVAY